MTGSGVTRLSIQDWRSAAKQLRAEPGSVALIEAAGIRYSDGAEAFLQRLESATRPVVAVVSGQCDATALAVLASATLGFVTDDVVVSVDASTVLALGLTSSLLLALGAIPARSLLFSAGQLDASALRRSGLAQDGDPVDASARLTDPATALLVRSFRVAARSSADQARLYDAELRQLL
jgi:enoyl-CoA hydratase/carnithine racemase